MAKVPLHRILMEVLQRAGRPLSPQDIHKQIERDGLYTFHSQDPVGIVRNQLRRHCIDIRHSCGARMKYFTMTADGLFRPLQSPIVIDG